MTQKTKSMNKKGRLFLVILFILLLVMFMFSIIEISVTEDIRKDACKELGFKDSDYWNNEPVCKDKEGDLHFVEMDCKNEFLFFLGASCKAKLIKVGEVWGMG